jgi:hypothetical protein
MSLTQLVPLLEQLSHADKLLLLDILATELLKDSGLVSLTAQKKLVSHGLHDSFEAAAVLSKALAEETVAVHG